MESTSSLVTSVLGFVFGLVGGGLGAYLKIKFENLATKEDFQETLQQVEANTRAVEAIQFDFQRKGSLDSELRQAVYQFSLAAGGLLHSMCWLGWDCVNRERLDAKRVSGYDKEAHDLLPKMVAQLALVALLDRNIHQKLTALADSIFSLDGQIGRSIIAAEKELAAGLKLLSEDLRAAQQLESNFRAQVAGLLMDVGSRTDASRRQAEPDLSGS